MKFTKLYRDPGMSSSGGGDLPPSLADIDNQNQDPPQDPPPADEPVEGLDADGNLLEGYEKLDDGTIQKIKDEPTDEPDEPVDEPPTDDIDPTEFWKTVETMTGKPIRSEEHTSELQSH